MSKKKLFVVVGLVILVVIVVGFNMFRDAMIKAYFDNIERPTVTIAAAKVESGPWTPAVEALGSARASNGVDLAVEVGGIVKNIMFQANDQATKGQALIQIDDAIEQAQMIAAKANINLYETQFNRTSALRTKGFSTQASYDDARAQLEVARSELARLQATSQQKLIKAPFSGVLGIVRIDLGEYVQPGTVVVTLQDLDRMKVDFTVPEQSLGLLKVDLPIRVISEAESISLTGKIIGIDPKVNPQTRLVNVQAIVENPQRRLLPGQFLRVRVELPIEQNIITVQQTSVIPSLYGDYVYKIVKDDNNKDVARQAFVKTGRRDSGRIEIIEGLKVGEQVVVAGQNKLQNGAPVAVDNTVVPTAAVKEPAQKDGKDA